MDHETEVSCFSSIPTEALKRQDQLITVRGHYPTGTQLDEVTNASSQLM